MDIPNIIPSNSSKYEVEFNIHTYGVQKGGIIGSSKNKPSAFQLLEGIFLCLVLQLEVLLLQQDVPLS